MAAMAVQPGSKLSPLEQRYQIRLDRVTERTPAQFRRVLDALLGHWGLCELIDDARFVATELLTNVHRHTDGRCEVVILTNSVGVHIQVRDYSLTLPRQLRVGVDVENGRGVAAIGEYAASCHVRQLPDGKIISAFIAAPRRSQGGGAAC